MNEFSKLTVNNMASTAPVSPAEERRLVDLLAAGRAAEKRLQGNPGDSDRNQLAEAVQTGQAARQQLIEANGRLVISIAARYHRNQTHIPLAELCQEGILGLIKGIDKFDPARGTKLSTYATWWIRQTVGRYVNQQRTIRLPVHQVDKLYRLRRARAELSATFGTLPNVGEVAKLAGDTPENIKLLMKFEQNPISLDEPVGEDAFSRYDILPDDGPLPATKADTRLDGERVRALLDLLDAREAKILQLRFGLVTGHGLTLQEISARYGLTRERIRQIEHQALDKLRSRVPPDMRVMLTGGI